MKRIAFFCLYFYCLGISAQWRGLQLHEIGTEDGLGFEIHEIEKDTFGYLYLTGSQGLSRYDGNNVLHFLPSDSSTNSISAGAASSLEKDAQGNIWIGMYSGLIHKYDPILGTFETLSLTNFQVPHKPVISMKLLGEDLWIGSDRYYLYKLNIRTKQIENYVYKDFDSEKIGIEISIENIVQDNKNPKKLWLTVRGHVDSRVDFFRRKIGLLSFNIQRHTFESLPTQGTFLYQYEDGRIMTSDFENQYIIYDPVSQSSTTKFLGKADVAISKRIKSFIKLDENRQWFVQGDQIVEHNKLGQRQIKYSVGMGEPLLTYSFVDNEFFFFTTIRGIKAFNPSFNRIKHFSLSKFGEFERLYPGNLTFDKNKEILYLAYSYGNSSSRIYRIYLSPDKEKDADFIKMPSTVEGIGIDNDNHLWAFGERKFYRFGKNEKYREEKITFDDNRSPGHCFNMEKSENGLFAMFSKSEVDIFNPGKKSSYQIHLDDLFLPIDSSMFLGNLKGVEFSGSDDLFFFNSQLFKHDLKTKKNTRVIIKFRPLNSDIFIEDLLITKDQSYWMCTNNLFGKFQLIGDSLILQRDYSKEVGVPITQIFDLHEDLNGRIWCFSSNGLIAIDQAKEEFRFFGKEYGLPDNYMDAMQVIEVSNNQICTVNKNGIILFHPDSLWHSFSADVPILINEIKVDGALVLPEQNWNITSQLDLPNKKNISISFQGLKLPFAGNLKYSYRLLGLDKKWTEIGTNNSVNISGLDPGSYTFEVKTGAAESNSPINKFSIFVPTPFHLSLWFLVLVLLSIFLLLTVLYKFRIRSIKKEEAKKTLINRRLMQLELKALRSQMNPHFMFNSLNSIKNYILKEKPMKAAEYLSNFSHLIRLILQNSSERTITLSEELETLDLYVNLEQLRVNNAFEFSIDVDKLINPREVSIPPMIIQPYVENAIWHGLNPIEKNGKLQIKIARQNRHIEIEIDDNGIGRKKAFERKEKSTRNYKSMGMSITQDRLKLLQEMEDMDISVEVIDKPAHDPLLSGTTVIVKIPV